MLYVYFIPWVKQEHILDPNSRFLVNKGLFEIVSLELFIQPFAEEHENIA